MVKSRFLGKPPKSRCRRTMIRVGVSNFVDNEAKNARLISIALNVFRTTFVTDGEVRCSKKKNRQPKTYKSPQNVFIDVIISRARRKRIVITLSFFLFFHTCLQPEDFRGFTRDECVRLPKNVNNEDAKETCKQTSGSSVEQNECDSDSVSARQQPSEMKSLELFCRTNDRMID